MSETPNKKTRRNFLKGTGAAAGALAIAAAAGQAEARGADDEKTLAGINALFPTPEQMQRFLALPDEGPIVMVNLLKFKPDGGEVEYAKYAAGVAPILEKLGAKILFAGRAEHCLIGNADWDMVALVEYPRKKTLMQMSLSPEYRAIHHHREAGLEGQVNYAVVQTSLAATQ